MTTKKRTTKPVSAEFKALRADVRAAHGRGETVVGPMYRAMDKAAKTAFVQSRSSR
jgi:hypothetical protein